MLIFYFEVMNNANLPGNHYLRKLNSIEPKLTIDIFEQATNQFFNNPAIGYQDGDNQWNTLTYGQFHKKVVQTAKAFLKLGLNKGDSVAILAYNCPEWIYAAFATFYAGGINVGIYFTCLSDTIYQILYESEAKILIVEDAEQMEKIKTIKYKLPKLKYIIQIKQGVDSLNLMDDYYNWSFLEEMDTFDFELELKNRIKLTDANECCSIIHTSGTTGQQKGIMYSHDALMWGSICVLQLLENVDYGNEIIISYLPLNHLAAQTYELFIPIMIGACINFTDRNALKDIGTALRIIHPTRLLGVPSVWKTLEDRVKNEIEQNFKILHKIIKTENYNIHNSIYQTAEHQKACRQLLDKLGLHNCKLFLTAGAPMSKETKLFFMKVNIFLNEVYGLTECHAISICKNSFAHYNLNSCGNILKNAQVKIRNPDERGEGEICMKGRSMFMGYFKQPDTTKALLDDDFWFKTGDLGRIGKNNELYITGRIKEMIITLGGVNIPTIYIESLIKSELPGLSNVILIGDKRKYLTILVTIKTEIDANTGHPLDKLHPDSLAWLNTLDLRYKTLSEILKNGPNSLVLQSIQNGLNRVNNKTIANAHKIQKFTILKHDLSIPTGELGPTLKIKRNFIYEKYADIISQLYH